MGLICSKTACDACPECPCCGYSTESYVKGSIREVLMSWMQRLHDVNPDLKLRDLSIMSSHDCGTYSIPHEIIGSSLSRTQQMEVYDQLSMGIRHIDFRYGPINKQMDGLTVRHGPHSGASYFKELLFVKQWVEDHPHEFLIIDAKCEKKINQLQKDYLMQYFIKKFGQYLITQEDVDTWFQVQSVTLGDIRKHFPKRVLLLVDEMILCGKIDDKEFDYDLGKYGFLSKQAFIVSNWHNTDSYRKLFAGILSDVETNKPNKSQFVNLQLILTPKIHLKAVAKYCLCLDSSRIDQKQYLLFKKGRVQNFVRELCEYNVNYIMMDFVNYDPLISKFLIGINFPYVLKVKDAFVKHGHSIINVLDKVKSKISRNNSLWIVDFFKDLHLPFQILHAEFHIIYQYDETAPTHKKFSFHRQSTFLLNCITHLDSSQDVDIPKADRMTETHRRKSFFFKDDSECNSMNSSPKTRNLFSEVEDPETLKNPIKAPLLMSI